jgi:predicted RNase H-like HicB family nuclease
MARPKRVSVRSYTVIFEPLAEGGFNVVVPAIPEICTFGRTFGEARRMAEDAMRCYLESVAKDRAEFPRELRRVPRIERLAVKLATA